MKFDSVRMITDIYDEQVRSMVGSVVRVATGASMLLTRGRTIRDFRKKLSDLSDDERKTLTERYVGLEGKFYENDSWRGLWDKILDTAYAMDARGNHRARAMAKYGEFLDIAEAIEARCPDAVPTAIVTYSRALTDLQRRVKNADLDRDKAKLLAVVADAFVTAFQTIGGKRRITGSRADADVIDSAIVAACSKEGIDVASGVVPAPKTRAKSVKAGKRARDDDNDNSDKENADPKSRKLVSKVDHSVLDYFDQMKESIGDERAVRFVAWLVKESQSLCHTYPELDVKDLSIFSSSLEYEEECIGEN